MVHYIHAYIPVMKETDPVMYICTCTQYHMTLQRKVKYTDKVKLYGVCTVF